MEWDNNKEGKQGDVTNLGIPSNKKSWAGATVQREPESFFVECWQSDYAEYFLETLRKKEKLRPVISLASPQIKYRGFLILELRRVTSRLTLGGRVLHIAVRLLDVFMDAHDIHYDRLLHVALVCLLIAAKFEVKGLRVPRFAELCEEINAEIIPPELLRVLEWKVLQHIHWDLCAPTASTFSEFFTASLVSNEEFTQWCSQHGNRIKLTYEKFKLLTKSRVKAFLHLTLSDMRLCKMAPSLVAASCVHAARSYQDLHDWPETLHKISKYTVEDLLPLSNLLTRMMLAKCDSQKRQRSDSTEDQGYATGKSSPESVGKKRRRDSIDSPET